MNYGEEWGDEFKRIKVEDAKRLVRRWKRKQKGFEKDSDKERNMGRNYAANRYEGLAISFRCCAQDLEKLINKAL